MLAILLIIIVLCVIFIGWVFKSASSQQKEDSIKRLQAEQERAEIYARVAAIDAIQSNFAVREHAKNYEKLEKMYSALYNLKDYFSANTERFIELCQHDISLVDDYVRIHNMYNSSMPTAYPSFKRLAMIYEKRNEYDKAIEVCVQSIKKGFPDDGTSGGMYGRLARMIKKSGIDYSIDLLLQDKR